MMTDKLEKIIPSKAHETKITREIIIAARDQPEQLNWFDAMERFGPDGTDRDWRLPTRSELSFIHENKEEIGGFEASYYWSSTEYTSIYAWYQRFSDGYQNGNSKYDAYAVRCVRR